MNMNIFLLWVPDRVRIAGMTESKYCSLWNWRFTMKGTSSVRRFVIFLFAYRRGQGGVREDRRGYRGGQGVADRIGMGEQDREGSTGERWGRRKYWSRHNEAADDVRTPCRSPGVEVNVRQQLWWYLVVLNKSEHCCCSLKVSVSRLTRWGTRRSGNFVPFDSLLQASNIDLTIISLEILRTCCRYICTYHQKI